MDQISKSGTSRRTGWKRVLSAVLAAVMVFSVTYYFVLPAMAMDEEAAVNEPGLGLEQTAAQAAPSTCSTKRPRP